MHIKKNSSHRKIVAQITFASWFYSALYLEMTDGSSKVNILEQNLLVV